MSTSIKLYSKVRTLRDLATFEIGGVYEVIKSLWKPCGYP